MTYKKLLKISFVFLFLACFIQNNNCQTVTMPNIIGSNMVLQQNTAVALWGWASAGISVSINASWGQAVTIVTPASGKWMTKIQTPVAIPGQAPTYTITVTGPSNTITFTNILVGEVWLCSGQSNMWFPINGYYKVLDADVETAAANYPNIRLFTVPTLDAAVPASNCGGSWTSCTPSTAAYFSAVGYYFGREIYNNKAVNVPVGLINDSYSGSFIQAWMKDSVLRADAALKTKYIDANYSTASVFAKPSLLYNAMIAPIIPFAIKGVIWYQGESNSGDGAIYTKANIAMIKDWRASWGTDFSFYAVQIAPRFYSNATNELGTIQGFFREAQSNIMSLPKTGIVVTSDLLQNAAERWEVHPKNKKDVGIRLALWALAKDYAQPVQYLGPVYQSYAIEGSKVRISFKPESLGSGLKTKDGGSQVKYFRIAGADKLYYYPALATIEGNTVVVSSPYVTSPTSVRYAFADAAMINLVNNEGLAAYQFRTDTWDQWWPNIPFIDMPEPTAVKDVELNEPRLFPNPCTSFIEISEITKGVQEIGVFDMTGKKIKSQIGNVTSKIKIDLSDLTEGAYMLQIVYKDLTTKDFKIIKQ